MTITKSFLISKEYSYMTKNLSLLENSIVSMPKNFSPMKKSIKKILNNFLCVNYLRFFEI